MAVVDVDRSTILKIYNARPDIGRYYIQFLHGDSDKPWITQKTTCVSGEQSLCATDQEKVDVITDWWLNTAGGDDNPEFYGGSLASFAGTKLGILPGHLPEFMQPDRAGLTPFTSGQARDVFAALIQKNGVYILLGFVAVAIFATPRRRRRLIAPYKGGAAGGETTGIGGRGKRGSIPIFNPKKLKLVPYTER